MSGGPSRPTVPRGVFGLIVFVLCLVGLFMVYRAGGEDDSDRNGPAAGDTGSVTWESGPAGDSVWVKVDRVVDGDTAKVFLEGRSE
jgi:hypothetical protein